MNRHGHVANLIPFKPGQSGNPGGRAKGARDKLSGDFLHALATDFEQNGVEAIRAARKRNPNQYLNAIARLMPRLIDVTDTSNVADEDVLVAVKHALAERALRGQPAGDGHVG